MSMTRVQDMGKWEGGGGKVCGRQQVVGGKGEGHNTNVTAGAGIGCFGHTAAILKFGQHDACDSPS